MGPAQRPCTKALFAGDSLFAQLRGPELRVLTACLPCDVNLAVQEARHGRTRPTVAVQEPEVCLDAHPPAHLLPQKLLLRKIKSKEFPRTSVLRSSTANSVSQRLAHYLR